MVGAVVGTWRLKRLQEKEVNKFGLHRKRVLSLLGATFSLILSRGVWLKFTLLVDNDTTLYDVHTDTVAFSLSV